MNLFAKITLTVCLVVSAQNAAGVVVSTPWPVAGSDDSVAVGAARVSGIYAVGDSYDNSIEIRDIHQDLRRTITAAEIQALLPWMSLDGGPDGPSAIAVSDSGRQVFILVHDDTQPGDAGPSDGVLLYDTYDDDLSLFARVNLFDRGDLFPFLAAKHFKGRLYVGTASDGIKVYTAGINVTTGSLVETAMLPGGSPVRGLEIDSDQNLLFAAGTNTLYRASLSSSPITFTAIGNIADIRSIACSLHYGAPTNAGLYVLAGAGSTIHFLSLDQARGSQPFSPSVYAASLGPAFDIAATACGRLLVGADEDALLLSDDADMRLGFDAWVTNEFDQVVQFCKILVAADGHGPGWVTDGNTQLGLPRFHPCTPDGACWVVLALILADELRGDSSAQATVRDILVRYAGQAADGIAPSKSVDGIFRHWIDPNTGGTFGGWNPEYATLSTMKIDLAAVRARRYYGDNSEIRSAATAITYGISNRASYINPVTAALYFKGLAGVGPDLNSAGAAFHEGIMFVEQAAAFQDGAVALYTKWLNRPQWPTAQLVTGKTVTGNSQGSFQAAFVSLYPWLLQKDFRDSPSWQQSIDNHFYSFAAWTDANGPRYFTVFSAGTTPLGYNADSLTSHPSDIATFPSLMAFCGKGNTLPAVAAYQAYRRGARETFLGGASILYRRSNTQPLWQPDSAGLPDVVLGAVGLAELMQPGILDRLMALDMSGSPIQLRREGSQLELSWPLMGWRVRKSTNLSAWMDWPDLPNPHRFDPDLPRSFYRLSR